MKKLFLPCIKGMSYQEYGRFCDTSDGKRFIASLQYLKYRRTILFILRDIITYQEMNKFKPDPNIEYQIEKQKESLQLFRKGLVWTYNKL